MHSAPVCIKSLTLVSKHSELATSQSVNQIFIEYWLTQEILRYRHVPGLQFCKLFAGQMIYHGKASRTTIAPWSWLLVF